MKDKYTSRSEFERRTGRRAFRVAVFAFIVAFYSGFALGFITKTHEVDITNKQMNPTDSQNQAAEEATKKANKGKLDLAEIRKIEHKYGVSLIVQRHIDGFSFMGMDDWGQECRVNIFED